LASAPDMTVVASVLSPEYAIILSDTRSIITGPALVPLPEAPARIYLGATMSADWPNPLIVAPGEQVTIDGLVAGLDKVKFISGQSDALAYSGTRSIGTPFLGLDGHRHSLDADRIIAEHFAGLAALDGVVELPSGSYPTHDAIHLFHANGRFLTAVFGASPVHLTRRYIRSRKGELIHAAIGAGTTHIERLLSEHAEWQRLRTATGTEHMLEVIGVVGSVLARTCELEWTVNNVISCWARTADRPAFEHRGTIAHNATPLLPQLIGASDLLTTSR
jgi:hypothetical protein